MRHSLLFAAFLVAAGAAHAQSDDAPAAGDDAPAAGMDDLPPGAQSMEGFTEVDFDDLTQEVLEGATLFGAQGEEIGPVSSIIPLEDGIGDVLIDVGDLVNTGETALAFQPEDMVALRSDGGELRLVSRMTREDIAATAAGASN